MPKDGSKIVKAMGRDLNISFKHAIVICDKLRGMPITQAMNLLQGVVSLKQTIPFRRFNKGVGHKKGLGKDKIGKYPKKAANEILKVLKNLETNSEYKGLDPEKLKIIHIQAQKGISRRKRKPKGRYQIWETQFVNVQVIAEET
jgi:large subunit ribosomal protein L22